MKILIIGGVAGGATAAARLRRLDEKAEIILLERGAYISYANCGLPYYVGGAIADQNALTVQTPAGFGKRFGVEVRTRQEVTNINTAAKLVTVRHTQTGEQYTEQYDKLVLSPGAEPVRPGWSAVQDKRVFTLRTIPDTLRIKEYIEQHKPRQAVIVGGGYIGIEMAENLVAAGLSVTIVEMSDHLVAPLDYDMACDLHHYLRSKGVALRLQTAVQDLRATDSGIEVVLPGEQLCAELVLLSIGVRPDTALAKAAGLALDSKGAILVNDRLQSSDPDIYAVGDAISIHNLVTGQSGYIPLAGPANKQGRIAADNICGLDSRYAGTQGSAVAKVFGMTVANTGLSETAAKSAGLQYDKVYTFSASHATYYPGATNLCIKLLFGQPDGRVLGAQIVGFDGVDKRCDVLATAIRARMTIDDLAELELCYAPPFSSAKDPVNMAGFVAGNLLSGRIRQFYWQDVPALQQRSDITLLDVRSPGEYQNGHIAGTVNIPLDGLRQRLGELDSSRSVYVNCQSGLRSYLACCILSQSGFDCYNLAGGYRLYASVTRDLAFDPTPRHPCGDKI